MVLEELVVSDVLQGKPMRNFCVRYWQSQNRHILKKELPHCHLWHMQRQKYDPSCVYILRACFLQLFTLAWGVDANMHRANYYGLR